jgi:FAD/FMN-containing dehydrogenase
MDAGRTHEEARPRGLRRTVSPSPKALSELAREIGSDAVLTDAADLEPFERPWRGRTGRAAAVVRPADVDGVRAVVRWAFASRIALVVQGANTGLVEAGVPDADGDQVVLQLGRLEHIRELDPIDRLVIAEAGVTLDRLDDALAAHDLELPIDLAAAPSVGGLIATNAGGARTIRHGDVRRRTLGVEAVLADPTASLISDLKGLRKDSTGLALRDLVVGSNGTLAIVTAAAFDVALRSHSRVTAFVAVRGHDDAIALLAALERRAGDAVTAFEVLDPEVVSAIVSTVPEVSAPFAQLPTGPIVLVELSERLFDRDLTGLLAEVLDDEVTLPGLVDAVVVPPEVAWRLRHAASEAVAHEAAAGARVVVALDVAVRRSRLPRLLDAVGPAVAAIDRRILVRAFGHGGDGGMHLLLLVPEAIAEHAAAHARDVVYRLVESEGGTFSAEHGLGPVNLAWVEAFRSPARQRLAEAVRSHFDPSGILGHVVRASTAPLPTAPTTDWTPSEGRP